MVGRIPVMDVMPLVDLGRLPAKATVGESLPVRATVFREGHDRLGAEVVLGAPDGSRRWPAGGGGGGGEPRRHAAAARRPAWPAGADGGLRRRPRPLRRVGPPRPRG